MPINLIFRYEDIVKTFKLAGDPTKVDQPLFRELWSKVLAICDDLPPHLQLPSQLPVAGQVLSNAGNGIAFFIHFDSVKQALTFGFCRNYGRRKFSPVCQASKKSLGVIAQTLKFKGMWRRTLKVQRYVAGYTTVTAELS